MDYRDEDLDDGLIEFADVFFAARVFVTAIVCVVSILMLVFMTMLVVVKSSSHAKPHDKSTYELKEPE